MEEVSLQSDAISLDKTATVVVDIESLAQPSDRSIGSPKVTRALSRKWSYRAERLSCNGEEEIDESSKRTLVRANSQSEPLKQPLMSSKTLTPTTSNFSTCSLSESTDGRNKRLNRFMSINPRKILFIFATLSSVGTLILIYFTLEINRTI